MHKYRLVAKKGEGTFSEVLKAQCIKNGKAVAIKCMKVSRNSPRPPFAPPTRLSAPQATARGYHGSFFD